MEANDDFNVSDAFAPVLLREGTGINFRLVRSRPGVRSTGARASVSARVNTTARSCRTPPRRAISFTPEQEDFNQSGLETTIVGDVRVSRLLLNTNLDLFGDFEEFDKKPTLDWRNTFSFRLTGALSLDYRVDILEQPQVTDDTQVSQNLLFRYSWGN